MNGGGAARQVEMSSAMERLSKAVDEAGSLVDSLVTRMEPVCRPSVPTPATGTKSLELTLSAHLPMRVNEEAGKMARVVAQLQDVLSRLEL